MSSRSMIVAAALSLAVFGSSNALLRAQEAPAPSDQSQPDSENSRFKVAGVVNANAVQVRSGPGAGYYATMKLDKGANVTVVGTKFEWLKILPPEGSFCYIGKVFVERHGDGNTGKVTKQDVNVRAGSALNDLKTTVVGHLNTGDDVQILGEANEYFKIKPPEGSYLYVSKQFVDPVKAVANDSTPAKPEQSRSVETSADAAIPPTTAPSQADASSQHADVASTAGQAPTTNPSEASAAPATTQPVVSAETIFDGLEAEFADANKKPLDELPTDLQGKYEDLLKKQGDNLPDSMRELAEVRVATLKIKMDSRARLLEAKKAQEEIAQRRIALQAEEQELQDRLKNENVKFYTALGTLQPSSLQQGSETLYRLTDPSTGRTVVYIRSSDEKVLKQLSHFVGVKGQVTTDAQLNIKVIAPTAIEPVDQSKVNTSVTAEMIPPSLVTKGTEASTGNQ